jgi:hypothetical protein
MRCVKGKAMKMLTKLTVLTVLATAVAVGLMAQGMVGDGTHRYSKYPTYDPKTPPPMILPDAYALALARIGASSNDFHCVAANCLELTNAGFTGWTFSFLNTNGQHGRVDVYFDGAVFIVAKPGEILIGK